MILSKFGFVSTVLITVKHDRWELEPFKLPNNFTGLILGLIFWNHFQNSQLHKTPVVIGICYVILLDIGLKCYLVKTVELLEKKVFVCHSWLGQKY